MKRRAKWYDRTVMAGLLLALICSCAQKPQPDPTSARDLVARAYASGAARLAVEEYQAAAMALRNAEAQIRSGENELAFESLRLAREFSLDALQVAEREKQRRLDEMRRREQEQQNLEPVVIKPEPVKVPPKPVAPAPKPAPRLVDRVQVRQGESLSDISARKEVYGDPLLWPLVYRANRDQIKDPMTIFPGQNLVIPRDKTEEEKQAAREEARSSDLFR